jgi:S1-C subfamily serine protease
MSDPSDWAFPEDLQPDPRAQRFDLDAALASVVAVRADIPGDAFTAPVLGTERAGSGVLIRGSGLVLTIGYLITEAETIWLTTMDGRVVPGHAIGQDQATGFGLVQALGRLDLPPIALGSAADLAVSDDVVVMGHGGRAHALQSKVIANRAGASAMGRDGRRGIGRQARRHRFAAGRGAGRSQGRPGEHGGAHRPAGADP